MTSQVIGGVDGKLHCHLITTLTKLFHHTSSDPPGPADQLASKLF
jgi:hypothetical protein